jgi:hypothetical protein
VEACVDAFVRGVVVAAAYLKAARAESERRRLEQEERERQWKREEERRALEQRRQTHLGKVLASWRDARDVRAYVAEVRATVAKGDCTITPGGDLDEWLRWCEARADALDPVSIVRGHVCDVHTARAAAATAGPETLASISAAPAGPATDRGED